jgi:hypothetical protein
MMGGVEAWSRNMWGRSSRSVDGGAKSRSHPCAQPARQFRARQVKSRLTGNKHSGEEA